MPEPPPLLSPLSTTAPSVPTLVPPRSLSSNLANRVAFPRHQETGHLPPNPQSPPTKKIKSDLFLGAVNSSPQTLQPLPGNPTQIPQRCPHTPSPSFTFLHRQPQLQVEKPRFGETELLAPRSHTRTCPDLKPTPFLPREKGQMVKLGQDGAEAEWPQVPGQPQSVRGPSSPPG